MPIITPDDVKTYLNLSAMASGPSAACGVIIEGLQGDLEAFLQRPVTVRSFTETPVLTPRYRGRLKLRRTPVVSVESVTVDGQPLDPTWYQLAPWGLDNILSLGPFGTLVEPPVVEVTYTAGLAGDDPTDPFGMVVKGKLLRATARVFAKVIEDGAVGAESVSVEGESVRYVSGADGWLQDELDSMLRWKRRS